jgi:hypothetical protein
MNPWLAAGAGALLVSERGRKLVRQGLVYGLSQLIAAGETAARTAAETTTTAGNVATGAAQTAQHGAGSVVSVFSGIFDEAVQQAHGRDGDAEPKRPTKARSSPRKRQAAK